MQQIPLLPQQKQKIEGFSHQMQKIARDLGHIELQMQDLLDVKSQILAGLQELKQEQQKFFENLNKEHGPGYIDYVSMTYVTDGPQDLSQISEEQGSQDIVKESPSVLEG